MKKRTDDSMGVGGKGAENCKAKVHTGPLTNQNCSLPNPHTTTGPLTKWICSLPNTHHHTYTPHETNTTTKNIDSNRSVNNPHHCCCVCEHVIQVGTPNDIESDRYQDWQDSDVSGTHTRCGQTYMTEKSTQQVGTPDKVI